MELRGVAAGDLAGALRETNAIAAGTRTRRSIYHASLNPDPGERQLTRRNGGGPPRSLNAGCI